jgi:hypothetical protein
MICLSRAIRLLGKRVWTPASEWIWTPEPTHEAIVPKEVWDAAQTMGMRHGNTRDPETVTTRLGRRYVLRSRLFCSICNRRLAGKARTTARERPCARNLRKKLDKIDVAETALITELETPADPDDPAAQALRNRIRARFTELYAQRTSINTDLAALQATTSEPADDPTLLDELPTLGDILTNAPAPLIERLLALFDLRAVYNRDKHQLTIRATISDATPQAVRDLLADPRADHHQASDPAPTSHDQIALLAGPTGSSPGLGLTPAPYGILTEVARRENCCT